MRSISECPQCAFISCDCCLYACIRWQGQTITDPQRDDWGVHHGTDGEQIQVQCRRRLLRQPRHALHRQLPVVQRVRRRIGHPLRRRAT